MKIRRELLDQDYINKLNPEEKQWLNNFNEEYVSGNFDHPGERIHPKKAKQRTIRSTGEVKKMDKYKNEAEERNNKRNNDVFSIAKSNNMLDKKGKSVGDDKVNKGKDLESTINRHQWNNQEDVLNELIDKKDRAKRLGKFDEEDEN